MAFVKTEDDQTEYVDPIQMYRDGIRRRTGGSQALWAHQSEILKAFKEKQNDPDIAFELPTGTGKTLIGLLVAEWTRRERKKPVIYACPTRQLAHQVVTVAGREGIDVSLLVGKSSDWDQKDRISYESAEKIAVSTYSSIFNSNPKLVQADLIVFDDAHAGEQYVSQAYAVEILRDSEEYMKVLDIFSESMDDVVVERLRSRQSSEGVNDVVRLMIPLSSNNLVLKLDECLRTFENNYKYSYKMIQNSLKSCLVYISYGKILIRPYIPPTFENTLFNDARQRLYLSATLSDVGDLERCFGRKIIHSIGLDESSSPRKGRRFFVFPELVDDVKLEEVMHDILDCAGKALVLAPTNELAEKNARKIADMNEWKIMGIDDVEDGMESFLSEEHVVCSLGGRYDGIDVPGDKCSLIILHNVPDQVSLQERFLSREVGASILTEPRVRTRIIQGSGRCTRGPEDGAVVLILGDLSSYLLREEVLRQLDPELQAEIEFGKVNSRGDHRQGDSVLENVRAFLNRGENNTWRDEAEPQLIKNSRKFSRKVLKGTKILAECVEAEVECWQAAAVGEWADASKYAEQVVRMLKGGGLEGYRAFWIYLQAVWLHADSRRGHNLDHSSIDKVERLVSEARQVAGLGTWMSYLPPIGKGEPQPLSEVDDYAVREITTILSSGRLRPKNKRDEIYGMVNGLRATEPKVYEPALTVLGKLLGASSEKPEGDGQCDSVWFWGSFLLITLEAKSGHNPSGMIRLQDIRQTNSQRNLFLSNNRKVSVAQKNCVSLIISPKPGIADDAKVIADPHVFRVKPATLIEIADDVSCVWQSLLSERERGNDLGAAVERQLRGYNLLPSQVRKRLTCERVGKGMF